MPTSAAWVWRQRVAALQAERPAPSLQCEKKSRRRFAPTAKGKSTKGKGLNVLGKTKTDIVEPED